MNCNDYKIQYNAAGNYVEIINVANISNAYVYFQNEVMAPEITCEWINLPVISGSSNTRYQAPPKGDYKIKATILIGTGPKIIHIDGPIKITNKLDEE